MQTTSIDRRVSVQPPQSGCTAKSQMVQSLVRALNVLSVLGEAGRPMSLTELARATGLSPSTAHRLLTTLQQERYVRFDSGYRAWTIGIQAFIAGNGFLKSRSFVDLARPRMRQLMEETGETVNLAVEDNDEVVFLAQIECHRVKRFLAPPGARAQLHCSAVGKALLAAMPGSRVGAFVAKKGLQSLTPSTLATGSALEADLLKIRARGYAIDNEEHSVGVRCVASAVYNENRIPIGAVSLSGPKARLADDRIRELGSRVKRAAESITVEFGGQCPA